MVGGSLEHQFLEGNGGTVQKVEAHAVLTSDDVASEKQFKVVRTNRGSESLGVSQFVVEVVAVAASERQVFMYLDVARDIAGFGSLNKLVEDEG